MPYQLDQIDPNKTVMIVVDMQNDFVAEGAKLRSASAAAMVPKLASTLSFCRENGIRVIYTAHVHRRDGSDMGLYDDLYSPIADRSTLVDGTSGVECGRRVRRRLWWSLPERPVAQSTRGAGTGFHAHRTLDQGRRPASR